MWTLIGAGAVGQEQCSTVHLGSPDMSREPNMVVF